MSNLSKRLIFAFTAMPIVAFLLWFGDFTRLGFVLFLNAVAAYEWAKMVNAVYTEEGAGVAKIACAVSPICSIALTLSWVVGGNGAFAVAEIMLLNASALPTWGIFPTVAVVMFVYIFIAFAKINVKNLFPWLVLQVAAPLYIGLWGGACLLLFGNGQGWQQCSQFLVVMTTLWACDSAAYFAGRAFGKHKFSPQISPKKTWEGAIGGTLFAMFWFWIWTRSGFGPTVFDIGLGKAAAFAFLISVAGQLGDLLMSALKRWSGIKDSGSIFPGHGGVLDRADSFYLAAPIAVLML